LNIINYFYKRVIHNPGAGGLNPPIATNKIKHLDENKVLFLCL